MKTKDAMKFAQVAVRKFLRNKPELELFRQDLEQEAAMYVLEVIDQFDASKGTDMGLWLDYQVRYIIRNYVNRKERRHFRKPPPDHESSYWELNEPVEVEEVPDETPRAESQRELMEALTGMSLTQREQEFIVCYVDLGELNDVAEAMGITKQRAQALWTQVVTKAQEANDVQLLSKQE